MRLVYQTPTEGVKAILLALKFAGLNVQRRVEETPIIILQLDEQDSTGNSIELMGELSIVRWIIEQSPYHEESNNLHQEEWIIYRLKPIVAQSPKATIKTNKELVAAIRHLEKRINGEFIGGSHPGTADILGFAYLYQFFIGNPWMLKTFPIIAESYVKMGEAYASIQEELGEKAQILKFKKKTENTEPNPVNS